MYLCAAGTAVPASGAAVSGALNGPGLYHVAVVDQDAGYALQVPAPVPPQQVAPLPLPLPFKAPNCFSFVRCSAGTRTLYNRQAPSWHFDAFCSSGTIALRFPLTALEVIEEYRTTERSSEDLEAPFFSFFFHVRVLLGFSGSPCCYPPVSCRSGGVGTNCFCRQLGGWREVGGRERRTGRERGGEVGGERKARWDEAVQLVSFGWRKILM